MESHTHTHACDSISIPSGVNLLVRSQDALEERLAHPVVDVGVDAAERDEELVLDVDVVLGAADEVHVGLLD